MPLLFQHRRRKKFPIIKDSRLELCPEVHPSSSWYGGSQRGVGETAWELAGAQTLGSLRNGYQLRRRSPFTAPWGNYLRPLSEPLVWAFPMIKTPRGSFRCGRLILRAYHRDVPSSEKLQVRNRLMQEQTTKYGVQNIYSVL